MSVSVQVLENDRRLLWGLCYRMTGNAADADDLVQETFVRALQNPPRRTDEPWRPWLVRVAMNLSRDLLRKRRRRGYTGQWLPSPVPTDDIESPASYEPAASPDDSPATRYDLIESVSFAFLLALEVLTPAQRAVLLLRDAFDYSISETASALDMTEANVKVTLHRARQRMRDYDKQGSPIASARREATRRALEQFLFYLNARDVEGLERLLTKDVVSVSDGGGEVAAALNVIRGRDKVMRLVLGLLEKIEAAPRASFHSFNGLPAVLFEDVRFRTSAATRYTLHIEVDDAGRIRRIDAVLAPGKLTAAGKTQVSATRIVVRRATARDADGILDCLRAAFEPYRRRYTPEGFKDTVLAPDTVHDRLSSMSVFVAVTDAGQVVGTIGCQVISPKEGHLRGMAVVLEWQGRGVAEQLLSRADQELRGKGCVRISLETTAPLQRAIRSYEKHGFRSSGKVSEFFGMPLYEYIKELS